MKFKNFALSVLLSSACSLATAQDGTSFDPLQAQFDRYAEDYEVAPDEAKERFRIREEMGEQVEILQLAEQSHLGGFYIIHKPDYKLVVLTTDLRYKDRILSYMADKDWRHRVMVKEVELSLIDLQKIQNNIDLEMKDSGVRFASDINVKENMVEIYITDEKQSVMQNARNLLEKAIYKVGAFAKDKVKIIVVESLGEYTADIRGGLGTENCTLGFTVQNVNTKRPIGVTTAAHCSNTQVYKGKSLPYQLGTLSGPYDLQYHTTPGFTPIAAINACPLENCTLKILGITRHSSQFVDDYVCKFGKTTGYTCGNILSKNYRPPSDIVPDATNTYIRVLGSGEDSIFADRGHSGGPVFKSNRARGTITGGLRISNTSEALPQTDKAC